MEKKMEMKNREERRKNLIIRVIAVKEGKRKKAVEGALKEIGAEVTVKEIRGIGDMNRKGREMIWVRLEDEAQRREVWSKKKFLRGK